MKALLELRNALAYRVKRMPNFNNGENKMKHTYGIKNVLTGVVTCLCFTQKQAEHILDVLNRKHAKKGFRFTLVTNV